MENKTLLFALFFFLFSVSGNLLAQDVGDITVDITAQSCYQVADGSISLVFNDSEDPNPCATYEFSWFFEGELIEDIDNPCMLMGLESGNYSLIVDNEGCTAEGNFTIGTGEGIDISAEAAQAGNPDACQGMLTVNVESDTGPFNISIEAGSISESAENVDAPYTFSNLCVGLYTIIVTDQNGCVGETEIKLKDCKTVLGEATIETTCLGIEEGYISVPVEEIVGPWTAKWFNSAGGQLEGEFSLEGIYLSHIPADIYTLVITDGDGCQVIRTFSTFIETYEAPYIRKLTLDLLDLDNQVVTPNFYVGEWFVSGDGCIYFETQTLSGIDIGDLYERGVKVTATTNEPLSALSMDIPGISSSLEPIPGEDNKKWERIFSGSSSGGPFAGQLDNIGYIDLNPSFEGQDEYDNELIDLRSYDEELNSCIEVPRYTEECTWKPEITHSGKDVVHQIIYYPCFVSTEDPIIEVTAIGPHPSNPNIILYQAVVTNYSEDEYDFNWTLPNGSTQQGAVVGFNNNITGQYSVDITIEGCMRTAHFDFYPPPISGEFSILYNCEDKKVEVCYEIEEGSGIYQYEWYIEGIGETLGTNNCIAGEFGGNTICVNYTDVGGDNITYTECIDVSIPDESLEVDLVITSSPCPIDSDNGEVCVDISGGVLPYHIWWSTPTGGGLGYGECVSGPLGRYMVDVRDGCGNTQSFEIELVQPQLSVSNLISTGANTKCKNGSISFVATGGTSPYTVITSGTASVQFGNAITIDDLPSGYHNFTVVDDCGVTYLYGAYVNNAGPDTWYEGISSSSTIATYNQADGTITIDFSAVQGTPFSIDMVSPSGMGVSVNNIESSYTFEYLPIGEYTFTVLNDDGCSKHEFTVVLCGEIFATPDIKNPSTCGAQDGIIYFHPNGDGPYGGTAPYTKTITFEGVILEEYTNLGAGTYTLVMTDVNGCTDTQDFELASENNPVIELSAVEDECEGEINGSIAFQLSPSTTHLVVIENIATGEIAYTNTDDVGYWEFGGLTGGIFGNYEVSISNEYGCSITQVFEVGLRESTGPFNLDEVIVEKSCPFVEGSSLFNNNGSISLNISGGNPPYKVKWEHGLIQSGENLVRPNLAPGEYCIDEVTDDCERVLFVLPKCYTVKEHPAMNISAVSMVDCPGDSEINITVTEGVGNPSDFTFNWDGGTVTASGDLVNLYEGDYTVTVTDEAGCAQQESFFVEDLRPNVNLTIVVGTACNNYNIGEIASDITGGKPFMSGPEYLLEWSNGSTTNTINNLSAGEYTLTVTDQCGEHEYTATIASGELNVSSSTFANSCYRPILCGNILVDVVDYDANSIPEENFVVNPNNCNLTIKCPDGINTIIVETHTSSDDNLEVFQVNGIFTENDCDCQKAKGCSVSGVHTDSYSMPAPGDTQNISYNDIQGLNPFIPESPELEVACGSDCIPTALDCDAPNIVWQRLCGDKLSCERCQPVVLVNDDNTEGVLSILPNPFTNEFKIAYLNENKEKVLHLNIVDAFGRNVYNQDIILSTGLNEVEVDLSNVAENGLYYLQYFADNNTPKSVKILRLKP